MCDFYFIGLDVETTGFDPISNEIIELGAIKICKTGKHVDTFSSFAKPIRSEITSKITEITGITYDMVKDCPSSDEVVKDFLSWVGERNILIAHNAKFDIGMIYKKLKIAGETFSEQLVIDTCEWSRRLKLPVVNYKLQTLCEHIGYINEQGHRAVSDARACLKLFNHIITKVYTSSDKNEIMNIITQNSKTLDAVLKL